MHKFCTSIEQSKKLIELGIDIGTADMYYVLSEDESANMLLVGKSNGFYDKITPAWSLSALLELMPKFAIPFGVNSFKVSVPKIIKQEKFICQYEGDYPLYFTSDNTECISEVFFEGNTAIEAAYNMVVWLIRDKHIC